MKNQLIISITFLTLCFSAAHAKAVYKCNVNGKIIYSDIDCGPRPEVIRVQPSQNVIEAPKPTQHTETIKNEQEISEHEYRCHEMLKKVTRLGNEMSEGSFGNMVKKAQQRNAARYEYEATCVSPAAREDVQQKRNAQRLNQQLNNVQIQQQQIQREQQQIQREQRKIQRLRDYGY